MDEIVNVIPEKYRTTVAVILLVSPYITRAIHALMNGRGIKGTMSAIWLGTNTPPPTATVTTTTPEQPKLP